MAVTISDEDFQFFYDTFEKLMSPYSSNDELIEMMKLEGEIWNRLKVLKEKMSNPASDVTRPSPAVSRSSLERSSQDVSLPST